jgi:hypothetical protein
MAAIFGIEKLSAEDRNWVLEQEAQQVEMIEGYRPDTEKELLECMSHPFAQGRPNSRCPNSRCSHNTIAGSLEVIALMPANPVPNVYTFGRSGNDAQLIFEQCAKCHTIHVSNQCN